MNRVKFMISNYKKYLDDNCIHYQYSSDFCYYRIIKKMLCELYKSIEPINMYLKRSIDSKCFLTILKQWDNDYRISRRYEDYILKYNYIIELNIILLELYLKEIEYKLKDLNIIKYDEEKSNKLKSEEFDYYNVIFSSNTIYIGHNINYSNICNIMHLGKVKFIYDDSFEFIISITYYNPTIFDHLSFLHNFVCINDDNEYTYKGYIDGTDCIEEYYNIIPEKDTAYIIEKPMIDWCKCDFWSDKKNIDVLKHSCYH